ncbi:MAG: prolipoprotein diacylglyceryl transferase [Planctomycetes bacterium]|nr:prolipoprotein diacylglyceryl transferase [Planctomycetota bacterium]
MLALLEHPNIDPVIFTLLRNDAGDPVLALRWYGLMYVVAFVFGFLVFRWLQKSGYLRIKAAEVTNYIVVGVLGTFIGGRLGYLLFYQFDRLFLNDAGLSAGERFGMIFRVWEGGMSFHGGVIGVSLAVLIYSRVKKHNFWNIMDGASHIVPFGVAMVRVGNFINGELYGRYITDENGNPIKDPDKLPWYAMKFPTDHEASAGQHAMQQAIRSDYIAANPGVSVQDIPDSIYHVPPVKPEIWDQVSHLFPGRWPSQIVQFALEGMLVLLIVWVLRRYLKRPGQVAGVFLVLYAIFRIPAELIRQPDTQIDPAQADQLGGTAAFLASLGMTMGQLLSVGIFIVGALMLVGFQIKAISGREYGTGERRGGFFRDTLKDLPEILGLRKKKAPAEEEAGSSPE